MTPPATAAAAPRLAPGSRRRAAARPRRVSGPGPSARGASAAAVAIPAPGIALPRQRPATPRRRTASKGARSRETRGIALRVIDTVEGISSSSLLDRLIRGRLWIGLLAFALIGIVAMQLLVLELNTGIGRKLTRVAQLQLANSQLGIEDSGDSAEARIDPLAAAQGMTFAPSGSLHFVAASPVDVARAAAALATAVQAPATGTTESSAPGGEASTGSGATSSQEAGGEAAGGSEASSSTTPSAAESGSSETSSGGSSSQETSAGQTEPSEATGGSPESGATSAPTGAAASAPGGGVQAGRE